MPMHTYNFYYSILILQILPVTCSCSILIMVRLNRYLYAKKVFAKVETSRLYNTCQAKIGTFLTFSNTVVMLFGGCDSCCHFVSVF